MRRKCRLHYRHLWDCPGHVNVPVGSSDFHFAVLPDDALEPLDEIWEEDESGREEPEPEPKPAVNINVAERIYAAPLDVDPPPSIRPPLPLGERVIVHNIHSSDDDDVNDFLLNQ